ncbi:hypothetical protein OIB37_31135 [Streptomyces sp. NBC_00820]|uniref:hypothetical protein n=1 Tax=Streptomyces sp. NBC_00820 TaxID=2975842 RepID=UPI002ED366D6|nr:hypothetical protein OIB37_31135 [Streptomyces sp. NBC_00820]
MSRAADVIVLAPYSDDVMEPLTREQPGRSWRGRFEPVQGQDGGFGYGWAIEFDKERGRSGLLKELESLPWSNPGGVQVLIRDQDDDCFGLWMMYDGKLVEVTLPRTERFHPPAPQTERYAPNPGTLLRTDMHQKLPKHTPPELRDPRPAW